VTPGRSAEDPQHWIRWQESWDRQQQRFLPDREERFSVLATLVGEVSGDASPRLLDLACGCGSITNRMLRRFPSAQVVAADIDPVLLRIAEGVFAGDDRVTLAEVDLRLGDWPSSLPSQEFDAVVTATALHWLEPNQLAEVYQGLGRILRPGGLFADADHIPLEATPTLDRAAAALAPESNGDGEGWEEWWARAGEDPEFKELLKERNRRFGGALHPAEFTPGADWHLEALTKAGFCEAAVVWRRGGAAVVAALR
jgi:SAM-dependent methyltransferase